MLPCIAGSKHHCDDLHHHPQHDSSHKSHLAKSLSSQFKEMTLRASGAYRNCNTCTGATAATAATLRNSHPSKHKFKNDVVTTDSISVSASNRFKFKRSTSCSVSATTRFGVGGSGSTSDRAVVFVEEIEAKEWIAQVEPGVLITFLSLVGGGNHLKRIRFSKEMFDKTRAQKWWTDNFDKVMELYNVQRLDRQTFPLPTPPQSEDEITKAESEQEIPATPPLNREYPLRAFQRPLPTGYSSSDSLDQHRFRDSSNMNTTPKQSNISTTTKTETSSVNASKTTTNSSRDNSLSISNASDIESEWVEEDEPGVYITIKVLPNGTKELKRVRFSREKFGEIHARVWWEENRKRVHEKYL